MQRTTGEPTPLIVTLAFDGASFALLDELRRRYFPPERNFTPAHLTLFHNLPGLEEPRILADLVAAAAGRAPFALTATGPVLLGRGVALRVEGGTLGELRRELAATWAKLLGPQDRQGFRPHVTVQNKVAPAVARALQAELAATFRPVAVEARGLLLWRYLGGPWDRVALVPFQGAG